MKIRTVAVLAMLLGGALAGGLLSGCSKVTQYTISEQDVNAYLQSTFKALAPYLDHSLKSYFNTTPAYVLNAESSSREALAKRLAQGLEVKPGKLVIPLG